MTPQTPTDPGKPGFKSLGSPILMMSPHNSNIQYVYGYCNV